VSDSIAPINRAGRVLSQVILVLLGSTIAIADELPDPTRPPSVLDAAAAPDPRGIDPSTTSQLVLNAIFFAEGRRIAIINDQRVGLGDVVQAAEVTAIERDRVSLVRQGEPIELQLIGNDVKRLTTAATLHSDPVITVIDAMPPASPAASDPDDISDARNGLDEDMLNDFDSLAISREGSDE